jgi:hypothetical protein
MDTDPNIDPRIRDWVAPAAAPSANAETTVASDPADPAQLSLDKLYNASAVSFVSWDQATYRWSLTSIDMTFVLEDAIIAIPDASLVRTRWECKRRRYPSQKQTSAGPFTCGFSYRANDVTVQLDDGSLYGGPATLRHWARGTSRPY